jgi:hypothetical protein
LHPAELKISLPSVGLDVLVVDVVVVVVVLVVDVVVVGEVVVVVDVEEVVGGSSFVP